MTREEAIKALEQCVKSSRGDPEAAHVTADDILIKLLRSLGYGDVVNLWEDVEKWYA